MSQHRHMYTKKNNSYYKSVCPTSKWSVELVEFDTSKLIPMASVTKPTSAHAVIVLQSNFVIVIMYSYDDY